MSGTLYPYYIELLHNHIRRLSEYPTLYPYYVELLHNHIRCLIVVRLSGNL